VLVRFICKSHTARPTSAKATVGRQKSQQLLTEAKQKVEEMIEKGGDKNVD